MNIFTEHKIEELRQMLNILFVKEHTKEDVISLAVSNLYDNYDGLIDKYKEEELIVKEQSK